MIEVPMPAGLPQHEEDFIAALMALGRVNAAAAYRAAVTPTPPPPPASGMVDKKWHGFAR
jgi:hypothetical protein